MSARDWSDWLRYAEDDLDAARVLAEADAPPRTAAFHAQQSAEKALKAFLVAGGHTVPRVHDLVALVAQVPDVVGLPDRRELDLLTDYAVDSRYPDDMPDVSDEDARTAIVTAEAVLSAVRASLAR